MDLNDYLKSNTKFLKINDGESVTMIYKGYSIVDDRWNTGQKSVQYLLQDPETDKVLPWMKASSKIATQMLKFNIGDTIIITRVGEGLDTKYSIRKL